MVNPGLWILAVALLASVAMGDDDKSQTLHKKMIARRREEHFILMKSIAKNPKYETRFQLLVVGVNKIYEIISHNRDILEKEEKSEKITEAKMVIIENTCLLMDIIVNFGQDNMIYQVFKKTKNEHWLGDLSWSVKFTAKYVDLLDELSTKEFEFVQQHMSNIMNDQPLPEYPYENNIKQFIPTAESIKNTKKPKERRKLKNKPQLSDSFNVEL